MHIAVVANAPIRGGAELYLKNLHSNLAEMGHSVTLIGDVASWTLDRIPTSKTMPKWSRKTLFRNISQLNPDRRELISIARRLNYSQPVDVWHLQYKREQILLSRTLAQMAPVVWTEHGILPGGRLKPALRMAYREQAKTVHTIIAVSEPIASELRTTVHDEGRVHTIENSVDTTHFTIPSPDQVRHVRQQYDIPLDHLVICTVSRLHPDKRVELAVRALDHLPAKTILLVAGDGPAKRELAGEARHRAVRFLGQIDDVRDVYWASDVIAFPSGKEAREGLPTSLLEAAATGLPIVATSDGGVDPFVIAADGVIVAPDAAEIAAGIRKVGRGGRSLGARSWAESHDVTGWSREHLGIFTRAAVNRGARRL